MKNPQTLMVQGTTSDAGKSILVTAICRILAREGVSVAPFKSQNMALNSMVTADGGEIGRAQAVQAAACFLEPSVLMNPVLLKPNSNTGAQVIVHGRAVGNMQAGDYFGKKTTLLPEVIWAYEQLRGKHSVVIVEGAGSPAEINLRERDIANMGFAETADCPVIIVADIDRGGVFAHLVGTFDLLSDSEKSRIKGFVINRFRGDVSLLQSGIDWLEKRCNVPILGVIPYIMDLHIEAEDAINSRQLSHSDNTLKVVVPVYPRTSNHTDFDVLRLHPGVNLEFIRDAGQFAGADLIILPGSKSVRDDLQWLKDSGWQKILQRHLRYGGKLLGVCGGFQMLGDVVHDPLAVESQAGSSEGLGFLAIQTTLGNEKILRNVSGEITVNKAPITGYEIHAGLSEGAALEKPFAMLSANNAPDNIYPDGAISEDGQVMGSYVHGLFDQPEALNFLLAWAGLESQAEFDYQIFREEQINRLADEVEAVIPFASWCELLGVDAKC